MATIANASSVYVSTGNGATPVKIYDNANDWIILGGSDTYNNVVFFHNNGNGTANLRGYILYGTLNLPNGFVANGYQTFTTTGGNINTQQSTINDGSNAISLGSTTNSIGNFEADMINWTINIRTTN